MLETILAFITLANKLTPGAVSLITMIRHRDGTQSVLAVLDEAEAGFDANLKQILEWQAKKTPTP